MAFAYLPLAILVFSNYITSGNGALNSTSEDSAPTKPILDPKRRNDLVEEAFLEQKDILLDMLEVKLKEVRDKKKKKSEQIENSNPVTDLKCELLPDNVDLNLKASGIVAVGETDVKLKFGETGNNTLNLNATGISNVGKTHLSLGVADGTIHIPGLNNLILGSSVSKSPCIKQNKIDKKKDSKKEKDVVNLDDAPQIRRSLGFHNPLVSENITDVLSTIRVSTDKNNSVTEETLSINSLSTGDEDTTSTNIQIDEENIDAKSNND